MNKARARYIADQAPLLLLVQAVRSDIGAKLDLDAAIRQAGHLYDRLVAAGHLTDTATQPTPPKPRATVDYVARLSDPQRQAFEAFFRAYWRGGKPVGKQRAAMRWGELDPSADDARQILAAAEADAALPRPADAVRKYPEGWLAERRWEDHPAPGATPAAPDTARQDRLRELLGERRDLQRLLAADPSAELDALLAAVNTELAALGIAADAGPVPYTHRPRPPAGLTAVGTLLRRAIPRAEGPAP